MPFWNRRFPHRNDPSSTSSSSDVPSTESASLVPPTVGLTERDPSPEDVLAALQAFVGAPSWTDTRAVLKREQRLLLSDTALSMLQALIQQAQEAKDEQTARMLMTYADRLLLAREDGITSAWAEFDGALNQQPRQSDEDTSDPFVELALAWLNTSAIRQQRQFLGEHPELVEERTLALLADLVEQYAGQSEMQQKLRLAREVIRYVSESGITPATLDDAFVNAYGGFVLPLPAWLQAVISQDREMQERGRADQTASARITRWQEALARAQEEQVTLPIIAEIAYNLSFHFNQWLAIGNVHDYRNGRI